MSSGLRKPSPAMVVACIALLVALSGASYAAVKLPRNSVGTPQLKKNAVVSTKVRNGSLKAVDFAAGQLPAGRQGPPGPTAAAVTGGTTLPPGVGGTFQRTTITTTAPGKILVGADLTDLTSSTPGAGVDCSASIDTCSVTYGVYVDNTPVPGAARTVSAGIGETNFVPVVILRGLLADVAPGTHTVDLKSVVTGHPSAVGYPDSLLQAIAIG